MCGPRRYGRGPTVRGSVGNLWIVDPGTTLLWTTTIAEQVFEVEATRPAGRVCPSLLRADPASPALRRDVELSAHLPPDLLGRHPVGERLLDRAPAEAAEHVVPCQCLGTGGSELLRQQAAENRDAHRSQRSGVRGRKVKGMRMAQEVSGLGSTALTLASIATVTAALIVLLVGIRNRRK